MKLLLADTDQLTQYVSVSADLDFRAIQPHIVQAQHLLIRYVGDDLLLELLDALYDPVNKPTEFQNTLIDLMRMPVANLAVFSFAGTNNVSVSAIGVSRLKTDSASDAFEWQHEGLRTELRQNAYTGLETLLRYLEKNLSQVPAYEASEVYQYDKNLLVRSAVIFSRHYHIDNSRLVYQTLLPSLRMAQRMLLYPLIGADLPDYLNPDPADMGLIARVEAAQIALVYATIARALRERLVSLTDQGVQVMALLTIREQRAVDAKSLQRSIDYIDGEAAKALQTLTALITPPNPLLPTGPPISGQAIVSF